MGQQKTPEEDRDGQQAEELLGKLGAYDGQAHALHQVDSCPPAPVVLVQMAGLVDETHQAMHLSSSGPDQKERRWNNHHQKNEQCRNGKW